MVVDASALLALLFREAGHEAVAAALPEAVVSTVNLSEVLGRFARDGHDVEAVRTRLQRSSISWADFDAEQAAIAAVLLPKTRDHGLSLGDRACLALGKKRDQPVLTADREWLKVDVGVEVRAIR